MKKILFPRIFLLIIYIFFSTIVFSQTNLAAYFRFCGCSLTDASGGGYVLTPSAKPPKCINTILDQGMDFANNNDDIYLYTYNIPEITKAITLAAWISPEKLIYSHLTNDPRKDPAKLNLSFNPIFTKGITPTIIDIYTLSVDYDSLFLVFSDGPNVHMFSGAIRPIMKDYQYYYVAATYNMAVGKVYLYFNGKQIAVHNYNKPLIANPAEPLVIGESFPLGKESFSGVIDEIRIYNKALSAFQIDSLYKVTNQKFLNLKDTSMCKNDSVILIAPSGYSSYLWKFKNVSLSSSIDTATEAGQYKLYARDQQQCLYIDSLNVKIFPNPVVKAIPSVDTLCTGSSVILSGSGASSYIWSDNVKNGISFIPTKTIYSVSGTDSNGCTADTTVSITFLNPTVSAGNDKTICLGESVNLSATNTGLVPINHFAWNNGQNKDNIVVSPIHDSVFIITVTSNDPACIAYDTVIVKVNKLPIIKTSLNDTICEGETSTLSVTLGKSYQWNNNEITQTINVSPPTTTSYQVVVSDNNNCKNKDSVLVFVNPRPIAYFTFSPDKPDIKNALVSFTNMSKDNIKFSTWRFGDSYNSMLNSSSEFNPTHEYSQPATYNVSLQVQDIKGCKDSIVKTIQVQSEYTFYVPNAFTPNQDGLNDFFNVHGTGFDFNTFHLSIYTRWGELIFTSNDINNGWDGKKKGEHQLCPIGTYVWHVSFTTIEGEKKVYTGLVTLIL